MKNIFTFREITEKDELEEFFRFRYDVFSNCEAKYFLEENENHLDINHYDVHSRHFALTTDNANAGYLRVVLPKDELTNTDVLEIGKRYKLLDEEDYFHKNGKAPFPFLSYGGVPQSYWNYFNELQSKNEQVAEAGRRIIHPEFRSIRTGKFLVECAMALFVVICIGQEHAIMSCASEHSRFFDNVGFIPIANGEGYVSNNINCVTLSLPLSESLSTSTVPQQFHSKFEEMANEFRSTGKMEREI